jgi:hypothetical protein
MANSALISWSSSALKPRLFADIPETKKRPPPALMAVTWSFRAPVPKPERLSTTACDQARSPSGCLTVAPDAGEMCLQFLQQAFVLVGVRDKKLHSCPSLFLAPPCSLRMSQISRDIAVRETFFKLAKRLSTRKSGLFGEIRSCQNGADNPGSPAKLSGAACVTRTRDPRITN